MSLLLLFQGAVPLEVETSPVVRPQAAADDYARRDILRDDDEIMDLVAIIVQSGILDN